MLLKQFETKLNLFYPKKVSVLLKIGWSGGGGRGEVEGEGGVEYREMELSRKS